MDFLRSSQYDLGSVRSQGYQGSHPFPGVIERLCGCQCLAQCQRSRPSWHIWSQVCEQLRSSIGLVVIELLGRS